jgi:hypothetical protein
MSQHPSRLLRKNRTTIQKAQNISCSCQTYPSSNSCSVYHDDLMNFILRIVNTALVLFGRSRFMHLFRSRVQYCGWIMDVLGSSLSWRAKDRRCRCRHQRAVPLAPTVPAPHSLAILLLLQQPKKATRCLI